MMNLVAMVAAMAMEVEKAMAAVMAMKAGEAMKVEEATKAEEAMKVEEAMAVIMFMKVEEAMADKEAMVLEQLVLVAAWVVLYEDVCEDICQRSFSMIHQRLNLFCMNNPGYLFLFMLECKILRKKYNLIQILFPLFINYKFLFLFISFFSYLNAKYMFDQLYFSAG
jgi:hypothetical protein